MPWRDELLPAPMSRTAIVAPANRFRRVLVEVADSGLFEPDTDRGAEGPIATLAQKATAGVDDTVASVSVTAVDPEELAAAGEIGLLAGEAELERTSSAARRTHRCVILPGWIPTRQLETLCSRLAPLGGAVAALPLRPGVVPPTVHPEISVGTSLRPLVSTYATVPYRDIDPTLFAAVAYMVMFGMMFGDVGHGLALLAVGVTARSGRVERLRAIRPAWVFLVGAGAAATIFGLLYGEAFGPTGLVPTLWLRPLDEPETLLIAGLVVGTALLAATFVLAVMNRWREAGPAGALYAASGIGGALTFAGTAGLAAGIAVGKPWMGQLGGIAASVGVVLTFTGLFVRAGPGASGLAQAIVEMFDTLLRLGSNMVSFTRLAAFGLTHAVITGVVWDGVTDLWGRSGSVPLVAAVVLFVAGNLAAFAFGALVAAIQALRLEYYEMFSRLFVAEGRPFTPWHIPAQRSETR